MTTSNIVLDLIDAFRRSKTMFAAVELGIFDGETPRRLQGTAQTLWPRACRWGCWRSEATRTRTPEVAEKFLRSDSPDTLTGYIRYSNSALYPMWGHLEDAVREGTHRWKQTFGRGGAIFSHFFRTEESMREFQRGMHGFGLLSSPAVVSAFDLSGFRRLVDLGGGSGHLAQAARERYPQLEAVVFDLPAVARALPRHHRRRFLHRPAARSRSLQSQQDSARLVRRKDPQLLAKIHAALPDGGGLLIAEKLLEDDYVSAHMQSLNMLMVTEGRERSAAEYEAMLRAAGFSKVDSRRTGAPLDAMLAIK